MVLNNYFAYGSNMDPDRIRERGLMVLKPPQAAQLQDFALRFNKRSRAQPVSGRANIVPQPAGIVWGILYNLHNAEDISVLDRYEYAPIDYRRYVIEVLTQDTAVLAWTYIAQPKVIDEHLRPSQTYLQHLLNGASLLPADYRLSLEQIPTES